MKKLLIFDFDGVIENTFDLSFKLFKKQIKDFTHEDYRSWFDGNFYERDQKKMSPIDMLVVYKEYAEIISEKTIDPGIKEILNELHKTFHFSIVSGSNSKAINNYLRMNNIDSLFDHVLGVKEGTSKVEKFQKLVKEYSLSNTEIFFITDTLGDICEANEFGISSIGVTWGFHSRERLEKGEPMYTADTPKELLSFLQKSSNIVPHP